MRAGLAIAIIVAAAPLSAEAGQHQGPDGIFIGESPVVVTARIEAACVERGFAVRRMAELDVICQAGDFASDNDQFRASRPAMDPRDEPQMYHRFVAEPSVDGAKVRERTVLVVALGPSRQMMEVTPRGVLKRRVDARLREFWRYLGATTAP